MTDMTGMTGQGRQRDEPIRILLVDDHPVVRAGLRAVLESVAHLEVVAEASTAAEALAAVDRLITHEDGPDVVVMDIELGEGPTGIEATEGLGRSHPELPVLIVSTYGAVSDVQAALAAGALGYLLKDASPDQLRDAVVKAAAGTWTLSGDLARRALGSGGGQEQALSPREIDILDQLALGRTNQQIAAGLFISQATVKTHLNHIFGKLGVANRTEAVTVARSRHLIRG
ncbi:response regulator transcription factor [Citricoccus nitrophenolicus]|uniref:LuxR family two component transcriptional regulator n=1 Tax=Citricoccus muralis TaxID=169134 RepID=A0A3D9L8C6_9MICC|nr:response regulator transcription factor [Citricoccus muralis]REE02342.1 LuxR family two component transcriptional regulator [Citricoccus muralis]